MERASVVWKDFRSYPHHCNSPVLGVFWDIENCRVPPNKSAMAIVDLIRRKLLAPYREAEFVVVCDIRKEREEVIRELNNSQVPSYAITKQVKNCARAEGSVLCNSILVLKILSIKVFKKCSLCGAIG